MVNVMPRSAWTDFAQTRTTRMTSPPRGIFLHHTVTPEGGASVLRSIRGSHISRGFGDIGYNWAYSPSEDVFYETLGANIIGAHAHGHNSTSEGLAVIGSFQTVEPSERILGRVAEFCVWRGLPLLGGHRDASGASTLCPGSRLHAKIPEIRRLIEDGGGMSFLDEDAQRFWQDQYERLQAMDVRPTTLPTMIGWLRGLRDVFHR